MCVWTSTEVLEVELYAGGEGNDLEARSDQGLIRIAKIYSSAEEGRGVLGRECYRGRAGDKSCEGAGRTFREGHEQKLVDS